MRLTSGSLKGGCSKTTSAVFLALGLSRTGRTLLVDADPEQASAFAWWESAQGWPESCTVERCPSRELARYLRPKLADYEHVVIDTSPKNPYLLRQALLVSDDLIVPTAPRPMELRELRSTFDLAAEVDATHPVAVSVLLVQVRARTRSAAEARALLTEMELPVLDAEIPLRESYALSFGTVPDLSDYAQVLDELSTEVAT